VRRVVSSLVVLILLLGAILTVIIAGGPPPCCSRELILRSAMLKTVLSSKPGAYPTLESGLNAAYGPCNWLTGRFRCEGMR